MKRKFIKSVAIATVMSIMLSGCAGCAGCNKNDTPVNTTPTAAVTATTAPTANVEPTKEVKPTIAPAPTDIPATPTPLPTPEPTATPIPTNTPVPTMAVAEGAVLVDSVKMGDNVWYDFYDDGTLVVRGTGATRDVPCEFSTIYEPRHYVNILCQDEEYSKIIRDYMIHVKSIVIQEGITELGDWSLINFFGVESITFPSTVQKIGYAALFNSVNEATECTGLRIGMEIDKYAFSNNLTSTNKIPTEFKEYTVAPTPLPLPTATPAPDPDKPKKYATKKMGDNVTFEFWDNGYLYVKGTGATWDMDWTFNEFYAEPYSNTHTVIIEEGVTYLGDHTLNDLRSIKKYDIPKSLKDIGNTGAITWETVVYKGYYEGKAITVKIPDASNLNTFERVLKDIEAAVADGCEVTFH